MDDSFTPLATAPRTRPGLWVGSVGNQSHSQRIWMLDTLKTKKVDQFTKLPMDQDTIARVNNIADNDRRKVSHDPEFRRGNIVISFEEGDADITSQMLELNLRRDSHPIQPTDLPDHFPLDDQGQANYMDPIVGSSRRSDVVAVDELVTATAGEIESEPPPTLPPTLVDIQQPSQAIPSATDEPSEPPEIIDRPTDGATTETDGATTEQQNPTSEQVPEHLLSVSDHQEQDLTDLYDPIAEPRDEPDPPDASPSPRYNLRPRRSSIRCYRNLLR